VYFVLVVRAVPVVDGPGCSPEQACELLHVAEANVFVPQDDQYRSSVAPAELRRVRRGSDDLLAVFDDPLQRLFELHEEVRARADHILRQRQVAHRERRRAVRGSPCRTPASSGHATLPSILQSTRVVELVNNIIKPLVKIAIVLQPKQARRHLQTY
jgi:hypothetical protein